MRRSLSCGPALALALLAAGAPAAGAPASGDAAARAKQWLSSRAASLNPARVRSGEIRFVRTRTTPKGSLRLQFLARCQGNRWFDAWEVPLPPATIAQLLQGDRIANAGRTGVQGRVQWGDASTVYAAMAGSANGTLIRPARRPTGLPNEGELQILLREIGFYNKPAELAGRRVEIGPDAHSFTVHQPDGKWKTVYRSRPELAEHGLPETVSLYCDGALFQRQRWEKWGQYGGAWLPQRIVRELYYDPAPPGGDKPLPAVHTTYTYELLDAHVNLPLKAEDLAQPIPDKSLVFDERFGFRFAYRYRASMTEAELFALAEKARRERQLQQQAGAR